MSKVKRVKLNVVCNGDVPLPDDYDGEGKTDAAVFRPSNTNWFAQYSSSGTMIQTFGQADDKPDPNAFVHYQIGNKKKKSRKR